MSRLKTKRIWPLVLFILIGFFIFTRLQRPANVGRSGPATGVGLQSSVEEAETTSSPVAEGLSGFAPDGDDPRLLRSVDGHVALREAVTLAQDLHDPDKDAEADIQLLDELFANYRMVLGGNPIGSDNPEITAQLTGKNERQLVVIPPSHPSVREEGSLLDRWQNPYYFHPLARDKMDIRSAGPDGKLWTRDDVSLGLDEEVGAEMGLPR